MFAASTVCIVVLGPTGSGKSELALSIAEGIGGEIVNFDSVQVYRCLDVGSAKLPLHERRDIPHHLIDVVDPTDELTAGSYARAARTVLTDLGLQRKPAILVGGTGFYLRALLSGLSPAPARDETLRQRLAEAEKKRPGTPYRFLRTLDPEAAKRIHPNDLQKLIRAVELAGKNISDVPREGLQGVPVLKLGLDPQRTLLYDRLNTRSTRLFEHGLLEETSVLLDRGVPLQSKVFGILGYRQALQVLTGEIGKAEALLDYQTKTRQYAKRQMTWFRKEESVHWLSGFGFDRAIETAAIAKVRAFVHDVASERC